MRKEGISRLTAEGLQLRTSQHYIVTHFIYNDLTTYIAQFTNGNILDIGCGNKPYKNIFVPYCKSYTGCDIIQSSQNVVDVICPADHLAFEDNSFDTVFSTQVIEHVENPVAMVKESYRVLKPGGHAIFTAPFCWELHEEPYDFHRFSKYGLREIFARNNFDIILIKPNGGKWAAIFQLWLNVLFSTRKYNTIRSRIIKFLFIHMRMLPLYNRFAVWLDKKYFDEGLTLNYIIVAKKRAN